MKLKIISVLALVAAFAGCASAPERLSADASKRIKKVGVVSVIGDEFIRSYVGATVFGNEYHKRNVIDWGLDHEYEEQLANAVRQIPGMTAVTIGVDRPTFAKFDSHSNPPKWEALELTVRQRCAADGVDGILVLVKTGDRGVGVWVARQYRVHELTVAAMLGLYDCSNGKIVAAHWLVTGPPTGALGTKLLMPRMDLPDEWPPDGEWEPATYEEAHVQLVALPRPAWGYTLRQMLGSE